jgi:hypothetical protein
MTKYTWTSAGWANDGTGVIGGTPDPGTGNTLIFPAGAVADAVLSPGNMSNGGPVLPYGTIAIGAGSAVDLGTFSSFDTSSYDHFAVNTVFVGARAGLSLLGSIEGQPATENIQAGTVTLAAGATLDLGVVPQDISEVGPDEIDILHNNGGTFIAPTGASYQPAGTVLQLGGPGFVQTSGFTASESEVNNGLGHTTINLGDILQGSAASAIDLLINNAAAGGSFVFQSADHGFSFTQGSDAGTLGVDTATLGSHTALLGYTSGGVHDVLMITDKVVAA